jgi:hypothetical protein
MGLSQAANRPLANYAEQREPPRSCSTISCSRCLICRVTDWVERAAALPDDLFDRIDRWMEVRFVS